MAWHYVNIEIGSAGYDAARDCPGGRLRGGADRPRYAAFFPIHAPPKPRKPKRCVFLIHFVGDVHQPLHAADRQDKGGNDVKVRWHGRRVSLHQIWDQDVVAALGGFRTYCGR